MAVHDQYFDGFLLLRQFSHCHHFCGIRRPHYSRSKDNRQVLDVHFVSTLMQLNSEERGREGGREGEREGGGRGREKESEGGKEGGRKGESEGKKGREGGKEGEGRERVRERE